MHLIIDGYNVMHSLSVDREWSGAAFKDRRESFLRSMSSYVAGRSHRVSVVFDGARGGGVDGGSESYGSIRVIYSARGVEADDVIREIVENSPSPGDVLLVSSDKSLAGYVQSLGASIARADELLRKLTDGERRDPSSMRGRDGDERGPHRRKSRQRHRLW